MFSHVMANRDYGRCVFRSGLLIRCHKNWPTFLFWWPFWSLCCSQWLWDNRHCPLVAGGAILCGQACYRFDPVTEQIETRAYIGEKENYHEVQGRNL